MSVVKKYIHDQTTHMAEKYLEELRGLMDKATEATGAVEHFSPPEHVKNEKWGVEAVSRALGKEAWADTSYHGVMMLNIFCEEYEVKPIARAITRLCDVPEDSVRTVFASCDEGERTRVYVAYSTMK